MIKLISDFIKETFGKLCILYAFKYLFLITSIDLRRVKEFTIICLLRA